MSPKSSPSSRATLRRIALQSRRYWPQLGALFAINLIGIALALLAPVPLKLVLDSALGERELPQWVVAILPSGADRKSAVALGCFAGMMVTIALVKHLAEMGYAVLRTWTAEKLVLNFRSTMFRHLQRLSLTYHDTKGAADSSYRIQYDAPAIQWIMVDALLPLTNAIIMLGSMAAILEKSLA
jgi:ATP-binding cassette, subfamily B, bacterial